MPRKNSNTTTLFKDCSDREARAANNKAACSAIAPSRADRACRVASSRAVALSEAAKAEPSKAEANRAIHSCQAGFCMAVRYPARSNREDTSSEALRTHRTPLLNSWKDARP